MTDKTEVLKEQMSVVEDENGVAYEHPTKELIKEYSGLIIGANHFANPKLVTEYATWSVARSDYLYELRKKDPNRRGKAVPIFPGPGDKSWTRDDRHITVMLVEPEEEDFITVVNDNITFLLPSDTPEDLVKRLRGDK